ncbi:hypothetical protein [Zoogloea sp.]|uniref:hypothetical protein n=1 Tax=Zoogloea sp. TaxID=49181 RepID=UPI0035AF4EA7
MDAQKWDPLLLPFAGDVLTRCDDGQLEAIAERAAILEFDAGCQPRALAEALAVLDQLRQTPWLLTGLIVLQVELGDAVQWMLATDPALARQHIEALGGVVLAVLDPAAVVRRQYRGVALLGDLG